MPPVSKYSPAPRLDAATDDTQVSDAPPIAPSLQDGADPAWVRLDLGLGERPPPALWRPDSPDLSDPSPPLETFLSALTQLPLGHNPLDPEQMAVLETAIDEGWAGPLLEKRLDLCDALHRATFLPDFPRHAAEAAFSVRVLVSTLRNHVGERNFWRDFQEDLDLTAFLPLRWKALDQQFSKLPPSERLEILSRVEILTGFVSMERADFWGGAEVYRYLRDKPLHPDAPVVLTRAKARLISLYNTALRELGEEEASKKETVRILRATAHLPVPLGKWTDSEFDEIFYYIHEALTLLPEGLSPLHPQFNVQAVSDSPLLTAFYDRLFQILAPVLQNLPAHWEGAHFFAARIAEPFFADPVLMDLDAVVGLNPLSLSDPGSRKKLAERIFRLSRGNQELQSFILRKLSLYCATESTRQDTILLLREMIPLSDPDAGKTFAIRDYSSLLGLSSPFLLLTSSRVARPWLWTREMHEALTRLPKEELSRHWREIGVGSGVLSILAAKEGWADSILATDIEPDAVLVARLNLWLHSTDETGKKIPGRQPIDIVEVGSATDLYDGDALKTGFTFGNLPVIPAFDPSLIQRGSYYLAEGIPEDLFGFGLIARLLTEGEGNRGTHFLTVPGWGGKEIVDNMASARNYRASIEHQVRVPWPKGAAVSVFASMEKVAEERGGDFRFRFYSGGIGIDAREVLRRERERLGRIIYSDPKEAPATNSDPRYQIEHDLWITQFTPTSGGLTASAPTITASARHEAPQSAKRFKRLVSLASAPFRFVARHARIAALGRVFRAGR